MNNTVVNDTIFESYIKEHEDFINFLLRKVTKCGINLDKEELRNLIYEQMWHCIKHHDPERSAFTTYLYSRCWWAFLHHIRGLGTHYSRFKTNEFIEREDESSLIEHKVLCKEILDSLPEDNTKQSLIMYVMQGYTYREIADKYNISHVTARSRIRKILSKIRRQYSKEPACH